MNSTVTKEELVKIIASQTGQTNKLVESVVEALLGTIAHSLGSGRKVTLRGFGVWDVRISKPRVGRNPQHPEAGQVNIPARPVVRFKVSKELKNAVRSLTQTPDAPPAA